MPRLNPLKFPEGAAGRRLALALFALAVGMAAWGGVAATNILIDLRQDIARLEDRISRKAEIERRKQDLTAKLRQSASAARQIRQFITGETPDLAAAALQQDIARRAQRYDLTLDLVQTAPPKQADGRTRIALQLRASGMIVAVRNFLHSLEGETSPVIFVDTFALTAPSTETSLPILQVDLTIWAYMQPAPDEEAAS